MRMLVVGVGNDIMGDDGIGPAVIRELEASDRLPPYVDLLDEGAGGMRIIHDIEGYDRVLIIDSADFGGDPGDWKLFRPEDVSTRKKITGRSLHEMDLIKTLELAKLVGNAPEDIWIMAVQPKRVALGKPLSDEIKKRMGEYVEVILKKEEEISGEPA
ncbi:MAG: hydrogenase maturation protease [Thermoplasmatota archaeon]